jgi:hypothetical protein
LLKDYSIQGWTMDVERLKQGGNLAAEFFEHRCRKFEKYLGVAK